MARRPHPTFRGEDASPRCVVVLLRRRPLPGPLASQASAVADPSGSVAGGAFHGRKSRPCDGGERDGCDDEFFHCVLLKLTPAFLCLVTDARGTMPRAGRLTPRASRTRQGGRKLGMEIVHTTDSWGSGKSLGIFFVGAIFFDIFPRLATGTGADPSLRAGDVQVGSGLRGNP